ncbi:PilT/PilU family type 4a pilus ATPase [Xanthomonas citri pv. citri]
MDIAELLAFSVKNKASDLHLSAGLPPMIRVDGDVRRINIPALDHKQVHALVYDIMSDKQRRDYEEFLEVDFSFEIPSLARFRVNAFNQNRGAGAVFRTIPSEVLTLEDLGCPPIFRQLIDQPQGLILVTGPTGSGKSTTLAGMIDYINKNEYGHILTVEDPIEFVHKHEGCIITQREVGIDTDSWENALKNTLRQAPDVIMIGEVRTREGMDHAIAFAETGHLVLCTLHANNANQAMDRIINFFPEDRRNQLLMDLSLNLKGVVAQQLIPTPDGRSRRVAMEIMLGTPLVQDYIRDGEIHKLKEIMKESTNLGMRTFDQSLFELYQAGEISYEDALRYADSQNEVRLRIKLSQGGDAKTLSQGLDGVEISEVR